MALLLCCCVVVQDLKLYVNIDHVWSLTEPDLLQFLV